jgi:UDP-N-acetylglucosamine 4,6-dehydratase
MIDYKIMTDNTFKKHTILITGGTGSLGKALTKELVKNNKIVIYSRNEERQFEMMKEFNNPNIKYRIGDIRDTETLKAALRGCNVAIHAAAMKDLMMVEDQPTQGCFNNIEGSRSFLQAVNETPSIKKAIGISTDKAASPSNVYGMTKYIMERLFIEASRNSDKIFVCSRFGNMINSHGSLVNFWKDHPEANVKIHHPDMARFFFTLNDAVKTVTDTLIEGKSGDIYVPKMKKAMILDILKIIFKKESFEVSGISPGEKIDEDLVGEAERHFCFDKDNYFIIRPGILNTKPPIAFSTKNAEKFTHKELTKLIFS